MLSYGGIPLAFASAGAWAWPEASGISLAEVLEFAANDWPGRYRTSWPAVPSFIPDRPIRLGALTWPPDARSFAVAHYVVTDSQLAAIRALAYGVDGTEYNALTLSIDDGTNDAVETDLFMLPPRPLAQRDGAEGLHVLTLVDERFFWWQRSAIVTVTEGTTTWATLFAAIGTALGVTITTDTVAAAYLKPPAGLTSRYGFLPLLLDAAAAAVGQRVARGLDGAVTTQSASTAITAQEDQWEAWPRQAGGAYHFTRLDGLDLAALVPATVAVAFPQAGAASPYVYTKTLAGLTLTEFADATGRPNDTHVVLSSAGATAGATPGNNAELAALATQVATDFYKWSLGRMFVRYAGIVAYEPEGFHSVTWTVAEGTCGTRVQRAPRDATLVDAPAHASTAGGSIPPPLITGPTTLTGPVTIPTSTAATATATPVLTTVTTSTGTPTAGFGSSTPAKLTDASGNVITASVLTTTLTNVTAGATVGKLTVEVDYHGSVVTGFTVTGGSGGATTNFPSGTTLTLASGSTLTLAGPTATVTDNTTLTVATGKTLTLAGAGTGAVVISAPFTLSGAATLKSTLTVATTTGGGPGIIAYNVEATGDPTNQFVVPSTASATPTSTPAKRGLLMATAITGTTRYWVSVGVSSVADWKEVSLGSSSGVSIGDAIGSGTANYVLFVDGSGNLGQSSGFQYDGTTLSATATIAGTDYTFRACDTTGARAGYFSNTLHDVLMCAGTNDDAIQITTPGGGGAGDTIVQLHNRTGFAAKFLCIGHGYARFATATEQGLFSDGTNTVTVCDGSVAATLTDGTRVVQLCDGTYAIDVTAGSVRTLGTSANTYRWENTTTAPGTNIGVAIVNYYGSSATNFLGDPDAWALIDIGGTAYKIPAYLA